jgi:MoxR-like ATPase
MEENELKFENRIDFSELQNTLEKIKSEIHKVIVGQDEFIDFLIIALLSDGHVLIEGVPGIAKTLTAKLLAKTIDTGFSRIQFTPDLMPSDVLGTSVFNVKTSEFEFKKGPIFSNIVLIDEINRSPAKTQAALFEVMEERQVTIDGHTYLMQDPFIVLSTQNPIDHEGTYSLPEAQLDRFLFKIVVTYPSLDEEIQILRSTQERRGQDMVKMIGTSITSKQLRDFKELIHSVLVEEKIMKYIAEIIGKTRNHPHLYLGASPRASIAILNASKVNAAISGRDFITPDDIKKVIHPVLRHRVIVAAEREMEGLTADKVIDMIIHSIEIPR